jgi:Tol biopolymer transport system component
MIRTIALCLVGALAMGSALDGCLLDGGGGGGGGDVNFISGFVFIRNDNGDVYVADSSDYGTVGRLTESGNNRHPSLSPDGKQAVYVHAPPGGASSIMAVATNGGTAPRTIYAADVAAGQKNLKNPVFSPDGSLIVFAYEVQTTSYLARVNADGTGGFLQLTSGPVSYASPTFYPDTSANAGQVLALAGTSIGTYTMLERIHTHTRAVTPVTNNLGAAVHSATTRAVLSRDGTKVAFEGRLASDPTLVRTFVRTLSSGATVQVSDTGAGSSNAQHSYPTWVSATQVAFVSNEGGADQVYVQGIASVGTGTLTLPSANQPWFGP